MSNFPNFPDFAHALRALREGLWLSRRDLAAAAYITEERLSLIETGVAWPTDDEFRLIFRALLEEADAQDVEAPDSFKWLVARMTDRLPRWAVVTAIERAFPESDGRQA